MITEHFDTCVFLISFDVCIFHCDDPIGCLESRRKDMFLLHLSPFFTSKSHHLSPKSVSWSPCKGLSTGGCSQRLLCFVSRNGTFGCLGPSRALRLLLRANAKVPCYINEMNSDWGMVMVVMDGDDVRFIFLFSRFILKLEVKLSQGSYAINFK